MIIQVARGMDACGPVSGGRQASSPAANGRGTLVAVFGCTDMTPRQQGTMSGSAIGPAGGAGIAVIAGGDAWTGAIIGGVAGGVAGNIHGGRQ